MSAKTNHAETETLNFWLRPGAPLPTRPTAVYVALYTAMADGETGSGTEVSGGAYARQPVTFSAPTDVGGAMQVQNVGELIFPVATANWGTVSYFSVMTALTGGTMLYHGALTASKTVNIDDQLRFAEGALKISEA